MEPDSILLNVAKGFAPGTSETMPDFLRQLAPGHPCVHLAGPAIATEFARGRITSVVMTSRSPAAARKVAETFAGNIFLPSVTNDLTGAALGCILKTFTQSYSDDLIATATSPDSHNRRFGQSLASGTASDNPGWLPEGVRVCEPICSIAAEKKSPSRWRNGFGNPFPAKPRPPKASSTPFVSQMFRRGEADMALRCGSMECRIFWLNPWRSALEEPGIALDE